jgi:hypothetical protein
MIDIPPSTTAHTFSVAKQTVMVEGVPFSNPRILPSKNNTLPSETIQDGVSVICLVVPSMQCLLYAEEYYVILNDGWNWIGS